MSPTIGQRLRHIIGDQFGAAIVESRLEKALEDARDRAAAPQSTFYDPLTMFMGKEWMVRRNAAMSFEDLRAMARTPIIASIIHTRMNQVAAFCQPHNDAYDLGFAIKPVKPNVKPKQKTVDALVDWMYHCGLPGYGDPLLETWARKYIRDSLTLDQACSEIVPAKDGTPAYLIAVDSAMIRKLKASLEFATPAKRGTPMFVQVMNEKVVAQYSNEELMFGIRNPQTEMRTAGYGLSELELLVRVITTILTTERYNSGQLAQGGTQKGVLVVTGDAERTQFESFKRDFREAIRNAASYWRPPVLNIGKDAKVDWVTLDRSNRDMEYAQLFDFLVKQSCAMFQIDPIEINWQIGATGQTTTFESRQSDKVTTSQQRGLKPLLTFLANQLNTNVISRLDPEYHLEFVGLARDRNEDTTIWGKEVTLYRTLNEVREELGLEPLEGGDIVLNQLYLQATGKAGAAGAAGEAQKPPSEEDALLADVKWPPEFADLATGGMQGGNGQGGDQAKPSMMGK